MKPQLRKCVQVGNKFYHTPASAATAYAFCWCFARTKWAYRGRMWLAQEARMKARLTKLFTEWMK